MRAERWRQFAAGTLSAGSGKWVGPLGGLLLAISAGFFCSWVHTPLPWMIGPLFALAGARLRGVPVVALPGARYAGQWIIGSALGLYFTPTVVLAGQLLIGCALASRFERDFLARAPRFLVAVTLTVLLAMVLAALFALLLAWAMPAHPATTVLAMAPGGLAEMSITAKVLQLGVPVVTAFHVMRMVLLVSTTGLLFRMAASWRAKRMVQNAYLR